MLLEAVIEGYAVTLSLIAAIGAQNAFVLRQGLRREHVLPVVLFCVASDLVLITIGVAGFGVLVESAPRWVAVMRWLGAAFLFAYGALRLLSAWRGDAHLNPDEEDTRPLGRVLTALAAITWLNPHVYLDTVVLLGAISTKWGAAAPAFGMGAALASLSFFLALGFGARLLAPLFRRPAAWRVLDGLVGLVMWTIAWSLLP